jgi:kumamolisin
VRPACRFLVALALAALAAPACAEPRAVRPGSLSPLLPHAHDLGRAPRSERHHVLVGLELRNREALEAFLADVQDPASPRYHQFLTQEEFNALHAPTAAAEQAVLAHLAASGVEITDRFSNRLVVGAVGSVAALERAFGVDIHTVELGGRQHHAAITEPSLPAAVTPLVVGVIGLDDLIERRPHVRSSVPSPHAAIGASCCALGPNDLAAFYANASGYDGTGQTIVIAGAYAWKDSDNTAFSARWGLPSLPLGSGQVCTGPTNSQGCKFNNQSSLEIALDVEYAHGTAPGARVLNYMSASTSLAAFTTMYNRVVTDNPGHVVSTSWGACEAGISASAQQTDDNIFANANAIGQSWFAASGDAGSRDCNGLLTVDNPANSPHVVGVGGTTPTCSAGMTPASPACAGYGSEVGWSGSGGGVSQVFVRPSFQAGCGVPPGTQRLVPDVALEADQSPGNYVVKNGGWFIVGGTSGAAPQWAGFFAQLNQKAAGPGLGNPGALLYGLCGTGAYHDIVSGSNGDYTAASGYDLVTGLGTIAGTTFVALAVTAGSPTTTTTSTTSSTTTTTSSTMSTTTTSTSTTSSSSSTTSSTSTTSSSTSSSSTSSTATTSTSATASTTSSTTSSSTTTMSSTTSTTITLSPTTTTSSTIPTSSTTSSTTSTATTTSSTTPAASSTTSTTIPACPPDGFAGLRCALAGGLDRVECTGDALPGRLTRRFNQAIRLIDRAEGASRARTARKRVARVARLLGRSGRLVGKRSGEGTISGNCGTTLGAMLEDGRLRAERLATSR